MSENVTNTDESPQAQGAAPRRPATRRGPRDWWHNAPGWQRWIVYGLLIVFALTVLPTDYVGAVMAPGTDWLSILTAIIGPYVLLCMGLNVVVGQAGLLDLGYVAFYAVGAYSLAYFGTAYGWNFWATVVLGIVLAGVSGVILGAPTLRLRGDYLAIVTLGFGEIVRITAKNWDTIGGAQGITNIPTPPPVGSMDFGTDLAPYYYLILLLIVLVIVFAKRLQNSRVGRAWASIREDEDAAELMGVPTFKFKLLAFGIGAMIGGLAGAYYGSQIGYIQPNNFPFILSATILAAVILGGSGNIPGAMLGGFLVAWLPEFLRSPSLVPESVGNQLYEYRTLIFAGLLVVLMIFRPEGLWPSRQRKAEMREGTGGMGSLGAEIPAPTSKEEVSS
jgi:branched-chain amino acid transport system permease protein